MRYADRLLVAIVVCGLWWGGAAGASGDDDEPADAAQAASQIALTPEQRRAIGIEVAHPIAAKLAAHLDSLGVVLDPVRLLDDTGELASALAVERAAGAEARRLQQLAAQDAGVSTRMLEAAAIETAKAEALRRLATVRCTQQWGPLMRLPIRERDAMIEAVARGESLLLRADLPGRHVITALPGAARVAVDGVDIAARVLGPLNAQNPTDNAGVLILIAKAPDGIAVGALLPVSLVQAQSAGFLLPDPAILYDEKGAYAFKQLMAKPDEKTRYVRVDLKLLMPDGNRWLVTGNVDDDDDIVVAGTGTLWSLEGSRGRIVDDDD